MKLSTMTDKEVVLQFVDGGEETIYPEEYAEICGLNEDGDVNFFHIVGMQTEAERAKPEPTAEEKARREYIAIYWQWGRETMKRCLELNLQREKTGRAGYLPKRVNDGFDRLSEIGRMLGYRYLDSRTRCQLERLFSGQYEACKTLIDEYAGSYKAVPMSEFYAQLAG